MLGKLIEDKKVRNATHRMCAWRVAEGDTGFQDDGEHGAGNVLLHLLETRHVSNQPIATSEPSRHSTILSLRLSPVKSLHEEGINMPLHNMKYTKHSRTSKHTRSGGPRTCSSVWRAGVAASISVGPGTKRYRTPPRTYWINTRRTTNMHHVDHYLDESS